MVTQTQLNPRAAFRRRMAPANTARESFLRRMSAAHPVMATAIDDTCNLSAHIPDAGTMRIGLKQGGAFKPVPAALQGLPTEVAGQPASYFHKDIIGVGRLVHPTKGFVVNVDRKRLDHWASEFKKMKRDGVGVWIPDDHLPLARSNNGWVQDIWRDGDTLMALCQFIGDDAAKKAARNKVSIGIGISDLGNGQVGVTDGKGRKYPDAIQHLALTPAPVSPGQKPFVSIAA